MWKSAVSGKYKFFFWLLIRDRLNTRNILCRKNKYLEDYTCVLCQQGVEETLGHLFFACHFNLQCWQILGIQWDTSLAETEMILQARQHFGSQIFREIAILAPWCIWTHRNSIILDGGILSLDRWKFSFKSEFSLIKK
ncbi:hypothetical protein HU200_007495 [Digitaria exilis]|uniref:Reverse transcriptase zinc-binding domain-containing protein n=1 Tax=Digitaria exilis TaxID=1010633 RepID=A0A835FQJ1_9POAL|nr:hypothetical protein HU200_007495 [Digitaria exilis]